MSMPRITACIHCGSPPNLGISMDQPFDAPIRMREAMKQKQRDDWDKWANSPDGQQKLRELFESVIAQAKKPSGESTT